MLLIAIGLIGTAAITSQILLVREIINLFAGNELFYGLTIFLWLGLYAAGSGLFGRLAHKLKEKFNAFIALQFAIATLLPAEIFISRSIKNLFGIPLGATADLNTTLIIIFILLAPITMVLGFQFSLASTLLSEIFKKDSSQISRVYIAEAVGAILGGIVLTYLFLFFLNAFQIAAILGGLIALSLILLNKNSSRKFGNTLLVISAIILLTSPLLDYQSSQLGWRGYNLIESADSPYGRISILEDQGEYNFFENGSLFFSTADKVGNEEVAHLAMLLHPNPKKILLIGGGVSGITDEFLKYNPKRFDYVELDYKVIELAKKFKSFNPKINTHTIDGIEFINRTENRYDLIVVNLPDPATAQINRFYTQEFFKGCKKRLEKKGMLCITLNTSHSYIGKELKSLNQSINKTFSSVFKHSVVIPGNSNYFFGSESWINDNRWTLRRRWRVRNIKTDFFRSDTLRYLLWPNKIKYVSESLEFDDATPVNTNLRPISYYLELLVWSSHFYPPLKRIFYALMQIQFVPFISLLIVFLAGLKFASIKIRKLALPSVVTLLGFTGMGVQLILIYAFQSLYGYVYQTIGLFTALFMGGLTLGSFLTYKLSGRTRDPLRALKMTIFIFLLILIAIYIYLNKFPLPLASLLISLPIGAAFPLAVKIHEEHKPEIGALAGILYGSDLLGGALAAIITTIFFIPIFGVVQTFMIAILFGIVSLIMSFS
ncbi:MAG: methyltransferase [Candidatus Margulisiibacteriota bacterium]|nr:methyltransferase [Candidatus Margulisiibacteriota bacterium]